MILLLNGGGKRAALFQYKPMRLRRVKSYTTAKVAASALSRRLSRCQALPIYCAFVTVQVFE